MTELAQGWWAMCTLQTAWAWYLTSDASWYSVPQEGTCCHALQVCWQGKSKKWVRHSCEHWQSPVWLSVYEYQHLGLLFVSQSCTLEDFGSSSACLDRHFTQTTGNVGRPTSRPQTDIGSLGLEPLQCEVTIPYGWMFIANKQTPEPSSCMCLCVAFSLSAACYLW